MKIYTLVENSKKKDSAFAAEHGISLYFEHKGKRILFDTGATGAFIYNATLLGIDLSKVDVCIISHAHWDHTGGLTDFLAINNHAKVYMKRQVQDDFYSKKLFKTVRTGLDPKFFEKFADRIEFLDDDVEVSSGVFAANIKKYRQLPLYTSIMYKKESGRLVRDDLSHELFIAVSVGSEVLVITGCSHNGIINILMSAQEKFGKVKGVIGGFHLNGFKVLGVRVKKEPPSELRAIAKYIRNQKIKKVYTGHCTGAKPLEKLELTARAKKMHSGDIIEI